MKKQEEDKIAAGQIYSRNIFYRERRWLLLENFSEEKEKELEKVVKQIEQWEAARMDYRQMHVVAKKIASILADNEALVSDLTDIFKIVKGYLTVTIDSIPKRPSLAFGSKIVIPDKTNDSDGIWDE